MERVEMNRAIFAALAAFAALVFAVQPADAQATWNYTNPGNVATATYPGNVVIGGTCTGCGIVPPVTFTCPTLTVSQSCLSLLPTWATTGTYVGALTINATDTGPANAASLLADFQVGGSSKFSVGKGGNISGQILSLSGLVGSSALAITGATQTTSQPVFNATQTWNNAGTTFAGVRFNATDTASAAGSLLFDFQLGGTSVGTLSKLGTLQLTPSAAGTVALSLSGAGSNPELYRAGSGSLGIGFAGTQLYRFVTTEFRVGSAMGLGFSSTTSGTAANDVELNRDGAGVLGLRNGLSAQTFQVYNTYTDALNNERALMDWTTTANTLSLGTTQVGTGVARNVNLYRGGTLYEAFTASGVVLSQNQLFATDNANDIGASGATRPRDYFGGRDIKLARHLASTGTAPSISACGTSPSTATGSSDLAGEVTVGGGSPVSCVINFNVSFTNAPFCTVVDRTTLSRVTSYSVAVASVTVSMSGVTSGDALVYHCIGA
jgi:hypothetical protein